MPSRIDIWIVTPAGDTHSRCFEEVAQCLREALLSLGYVSDIVTDPAKIRGRAIALGAHLSLKTGEPLPPDAIVYNLEQIGADLPSRLPGYLELLMKHLVWDYSAANIQQLKQHGIAAKLCRLGYMPVLTRIQPAFEDIDVLFIGSVNPRRQAVIDGLKAQGRKVHVAYGVYGEERDRLIARAKIMLNVHFYDSHIFEIVRVSHYLANRKCVVSESGQDATMEAPFRGGVAFVDYDALVPTCNFLLGNTEQRHRYADKGFACIRGLPQAPLLEQALADRAVAA